MVLRCAFCLGLILLMGCRKETTPSSSREHDREKIVAIVGGDSISLYDYKEFVDAQAGPKPDLQNTQMRQRLLDAIIADRLIVQYCYDARLQETDSIRFKVRTQQDEIYYQRLLRKVVYEPMITDEEMRAYYEKSRTEVRLRQIFIGMAEGKEITISRKGRQATRDRDTAKKLADSVYAALHEHPELFSFLVSNYSDDWNSRYLEGDIGYIRWGEAEARSQEAAFSLKQGEISKPVETAEGYHIFEAVERRTVDNLKPYEATREILRAVLSEKVPITRKDELEQRAKSFNDSIIQTYGYRTDRNGIALFLRRYQSVSQPGEIRKAFAEEEKKLPLASFTGGALLVEDLIAAMEHNQKKLSLDEKRLSEGLRNAAVIRIGSSLAQQQGYMPNGTEMKYLKRLEKELIVNVAYRLNIDDKFVVNDNDVRTFYQNNLTRYRMPDRVNVAEIALPDPNAVAALAREILAKNNFDSVYHRAAKWPNNHCRITGMISDTGQDETLVMVAKLKAGEISEPFSKSNGDRALVKVLARESGDIQKFEKVYERIKADYTGAKKRMLYQEWIARLSGTRKIQQFPEVLKTAYDLTIH